MNGVILKTSIELFGLIDGFKFWFNWSVIDPIKYWIWLNITHKPYCLNCGWYCNKDCKDKLYTKRDIKEHWKEMDKKANEVIKGKNGECAYCGEEQGVMEIPNPNLHEINLWSVCANCKETIYYQQQLSFGLIIKDSKLIEEANENLKKIAERTKKPIFNIEFIKNKEGGYDYSSIEFTEEK